MDIFFNLNNHYIPILESNGRNLRIFLDDFVSFLFKPFMVPYFSLLLSTIIYSYSFVLLYRYFNISDESFRIIFPFCIILPCFTLLNPFYHDLIYYSLSFLFSIVSFNILSKTNIRFKLLIFVSINLLILFIYQLNFFFIISLLCYDLIINILNKNKYKDIITNVVNYSFSLFIIIMFYLIIIKLLNIGINTRGAQFSLFNVLKTYAAFLILPFTDYMQINELLVSKLAILLIYFVDIYLIYKTLSNNKFNDIYKLVLLLLILIFPIAMNSVLLLLKNPSRGMFSEIYLLIIPYTFINYCQISIKIKKRIVTLLSISFTLVFLSNFYTSNARYLELKNRSDSEKAWTIELVSSIRNTEGYNSNIKIVFLTKTEGNIEDINLSDYYEDYIYDRFRAEHASSILRYNYGRGIQLALNYYGAFKYNEASMEEADNIINDEIVKNMPVYPNCGSIKVINNILVVKLY